MNCRFTFAAGHVALSETGLASASQWCRSRDRKVTCKKETTSENTNPNRSSGEDENRLGNLDQCQDKKGFFFVLAIGAL